MEFILETPIEVHSKEAGKIVEQSAINVVYTGKKGLKALKRLQDKIYTSFSNQAKGKDTSKDENKKDEVVTVDDIFDGLEMTGQSEVLFDEVCGTFKAFATIGDAKLDDSMQDQMEHEDLEKLYEGVLKHFLLPKICHKMNSMKK